jgi:hypothetical protein
MSTHYNQEQEQELEYKNKAEMLAEKIKDKFNSLHKIVFRVKGKYHAVLLTEDQLHLANKKASKEGMTLQQYYINKYSEI